MCIIDILLIGLVLLALLAFGMNIARNLKQRGMKITDRWKVTKTGKRVKEYLLAI